MPVCFETRPATLTASLMVCWTERPCRSQGSDRNAILVLTIQKSKVGFPSPHLLGIMTLDAALPARNIMSRAPAPAGTDNRGICRGRHSGCRLPRHVLALAAAGRPHSVR